MQFWPGIRCSESSNGIEAALSIVTCWIVLSHMRHLNHRNYDHIIRPVVVLSFDGHCTNTVLPIVQRQADTLHRADGVRLAEGLRNAGADYRLGCCRPGWTSSLAQDTV